MKNIVYPMPICKACGRTIDIKDGIKEIVTPFGEHQFYHKDCESEWEKGSKFLKEMTDVKPRLSHMSLHDLIELHQKVSRAIERKVEENYFKRESKK